MKSVFKTMAVAIAVAGVCVDDAEAMGSKKKKPVKEPVAERVLNFGLPDYRVSEHDMRCFVDEAAPLYLSANSIAVGTDARPEGVTRGIIQPYSVSEARLPYRVKGFSIRDLPVDYAVLRLVRELGMGVYADKPNSMPRITVDALNGPLDQVLDRLARQAGVKWSTDGKNVYLYKELEWSMERPNHRDLTIAMVDGLKANGATYAALTPDGSRVIFGADEMGAATLEARMKFLLVQSNIVTFDTAYYRVQPKDGRVELGSLIESTHAVEAFTEVDGAKVLFLDSSRFRLVEDFLARQGGLDIARKQIVSAPATWSVNVDNEICGAIAGFENHEFGFAPSGVLEDRVSFGFDIKRDGETHVAFNSTLKIGNMGIVLDEVSEDGYFLVTVFRPRVVSLVGSR